MPQLRRYSYKGPVMMFDRCVANAWTGETIAESKAKAKSNLTYQYKKSHNLSSGTKVTLTGEVVMEYELALV